uniref:Uncharacterized protein n=1 Tax=Magallana gigas TaxID=29159 RepID=K1QBC4_MAGGI
MFVSVGYLIIAAYQWYRNRVRHSMVHRYISSSLRLGSVIVQRIITGIPNDSSRLHMRCVQALEGPVSNTIFQCLASEQE